ncbi:MAG: TatD family deoxyribonuclease, partial [Mucilaginibacter sp.]|nr:TatD family deoxyribonuclease [Mucilaginibacter sp.]
MQRCLAGGIERLFLPNVDSSSIELVMSQVKTFPDNCFAMLGLHPCDVKASWQDELGTINTAIHQHKIYAIGEIGIDLYWDKTFLKEQVEVFKMQIGWAKKLRLPIVIHCRAAFDEVYAILQEEQDEDLRGIFHCFTGTLEQAQKVIALGFYLG